MRHSVAPNKNDAGMQALMRKDLGGPLLVKTSLTSSEQGMGRNLFWGALLRCVHGSWKGYVHK